MCLDQLRLEVKFRPRCLWLKTITFPPSLSNPGLVGPHFLENNMITVFSLLIVTNNLLHHFMIISRSLLSNLTALSISQYKTYQNSKVSSGKDRQDWTDHHQYQFMSITNNRGPRTLPWGTQALRTLHCDL